MCSLGLSAAWAFAQVVDILEGLSGHLSVPLPGMRYLVLGHRTQHRLPDIVDRGQVEAQARDGNGERGEQRVCELSGV